VKAAQGGSNKVVKSWLLMVFANRADVAIFHETDLTKWKTLEAAFEKAKSAFGKINIVVNNAGIVETSSWLNDNDPREEVCDYLVLNVDLTAVAKGTRLAIQYFAKNPEVGEGVVISTSSLYGLYNSGIVPLYAAAKAGVISLVKSHGMAREQTNTRHVAIAPWFVDTPLLEDTFRQVLDATKIQLIQPEVVVDAFIFAIENDELNGKETSQLSIVTTQ
jgi:NAD(P)-dependent dehydrogenase (short-subunit alcohol dehydrogenase family)